MSLPPLKVNKGIIRKMIEKEKIIENNKIQNEKEKKYRLAKKQYENDLHNIMEKIISIKYK